MRISLFFLIGLFAFINFTFAHGDEPSLSDTISDTSISLVSVAGALILLLVIWAAAKKERGELFKGIIFALIAFLALGTTFYLSASTIYLNTVSESGGPVHWHADFRIFNCGQEVFLEEPKGLSNRIGKADLHEHGDGRIHIEGVVVEHEDFSLQNYFEAIGGTLKTGELAFPSKPASPDERASRGGDNFEWMVNGQKCSDSNSGKLQVFLYKTEGKIIRQEKLENFTDYVPSPYSQIPPGDCVIFEFSPDEKEQTDIICNFTDIAIKKGDYRYEK